MAAPCGFELDEDEDELGEPSAAFPGELVVVDVTRDVTLVARLEGEAMDAAPSMLMSLVESVVEALVSVVVLIFELSIVEINVRVDVTVDVELGGDRMTVTTAPFMNPSHAYPKYAHCASSGQQRTPHGVSPKSSLHLATSGQPFC